MCSHLSQAQKNSRQVDMMKDNYGILKNLLTENFMITVVNVDEGIVEINENFWKVMGYKLPELYMKSYWELNFSHRSEELQKEVMELLQVGKQWKGEICLQAKNEELVWLQTTIIPFLDNHNRLNTYVVVSLDITETMMADKWKSLACRHELTNLPNRRMLDLSLRNYVARAKRNETTLAVLFLDINKFKSINDQFGHIAGDHFLRELGSRLTSIPTLKNRVFHISGDEFIIILEDVKGLEERVNPILEIFKEPFMMRNDNKHVSASIGISLYPEHGEDIQMIIQNANDAMFAAKYSRRETFLVHEI